MKKIMCTVLVLALAILPACAQRSVPKAATNARKKITQTTRKNTNTRIGTQVNRSAAEHARRNVTTMRKGQEGASTPAKSVAAQVSAAPQVPPLRMEPTHSVKAPEESSMKELEEYLQQTRAESKALDLEEQQLMFQSSFGKSVLSIPNLAVKDDPYLLNEYDEAVQAYSMTIIKTNYNGGEEIFGIIPTHSLPATPKAGAKMFGVTKKFHAKMLMADGTEKLISGEVVQISPHSMLDISLVKLDPEAESLLNPLEVSRESAKIDEPILSPGFANDRPMIFQRTVTQTSHISIRTNLIKAPLDQRQGFCGSPLLDANGRVKAVHTGSWNESSYGTKARFIDNLVEAYHNNGKSMYDLELDGEVLTSLNVDEYISAFAVADEKMNILYKADGLERDGHPFEKYSETRLRNAINTPSARYLVLHSRTPRWQKVGNSNELWLMENRTDMNITADKLREHVYDLQNHKLLREPFTYTDFYEGEFYEMDEHPMLVLKQLDGIPIQH